MKKFTLIIFVLLISVGLSAQKISDTGLKLLDMQKKYSEINRQFAGFNKPAQLTFPAPALKSAVFLQKLDSTVSQVYNDGSQTWQKDYKDEFLYDQEMRNIAWTYREWNLTTHAWDPDFKTELSYDGNGRVSSMTMYEADTLTNMFVEDSRYNYYYSPDGTPDSVLIWITEDAGANWDLISKQRNYYSPSKQLTKTETWNYDEDEGALVLGMKTDYSYTGTGKIKTSVSSFLIEGTEFPTNKSEYGYDGSDRVSTIEYYDVNFFTQVLELSSRDMFQYNSNGDVSTQIYSSWSGAAWIEEDKDEYEYTTMNLSDVAFPLFIALFGEDDGYDELKYSKAISKINTFEKNGGDWIHTDIVTFYYSASGSSTGIVGVKNAGFRLYPNPVSETVTFSWKANSSPFVLKIYQVTGAQVLEQNTWSGKEISVSQLINGVYLFKLMNGQQTVYSGKLVKR